MLSGALTNCESTRKSVLRSIRPFSTPRGGTTATILLPMKAKPCTRLPNPGRVFRGEHAGVGVGLGADAETVVASASEPVIAGAR